MPVSNQHSENDFINQLTEQLSRQDNWKVEKEPNGGSADLLIEDTNSGKRIFIEFKERGQYGELPISSILSLDKQKSQLSVNDTLFPVTFSGISALLKAKLKDLGIRAFAKPSVEDMVGNVQYAMSA